MYANPLIIGECRSWGTIKRELLEITTLIDASVEDITSVRITIITFLFALEVGVSVCKERNEIA